MAARPIPAQRAATLLIAVGALNLAITLFVALIAARGWGRIPELAVTARVLDAQGAEVASHELRSPTELELVAAEGLRTSSELPSGGRLEVEVPRAHFDAVAQSGNLLRVLQLAIPLLVSALFLAAGLRLRRLARG